MKKTTILILTVILLGACTNKKENFETVETDTVDLICGNGSTDPRDYTYHITVTAKADNSKCVVDSSVVFDRTFTYDSLVGSIQDLCQKAYDHTCYYTHTINITIIGMRVGEHNRYNKLDNFLYYPYTNDDGYMKLNVRVYNNYETMKVTGKRVKCSIDNAARFFGDPESTFHVIGDCVVDDEGHTYGCNYYKCEIYEDKFIYPTEISLD